MSKFIMVRTNLSCHFDPALAGRNLALKISQSACPVIGLAADAAPLFGDYARRVVIPLYVATAYVAGK